MLTYPMLNDRPIDQWMVTELKDELQQRNLPINGLKDDLVKRLFEAIQDKILDDGEKTSDGTTPEQVKNAETPGSVDASVNQGSIKEHIDEGASEVTKQGADLVISVTEASDESMLATSEVTQEAVVDTAEATQRSLDAVAEVESSLVDTAATNEANGNGLESASSGNTRVEEANPRSEDHSDTTEKKPEDDTNKKMAVDDVPSNVNGGGINLGFNMHSKILDVEDVPAPPDDIILHGDPEDVDAVAAAEPEDGTSKKMAIDEASYDVTHATAKLDVKVDCKTEQDEVPALPDAIELHADPKYANVVAATENMIEANGNGLESASSGNTRVDETNPRSEDHGDATENTPENDTNKKMDVDDGPYDVNGGGIKLGFNMYQKIIEMEDVPSPPDDIVLHGDPEDVDAVSAAESEDGTSKKMVIDEVSSDVTHATAKLDVKVDCKTEGDEVPALPDAIELHVDPKDTDVVAAAENMIAKDNFSGYGHGDPKFSNGDTEPFLCREKDQVSKVNPDLDSQVKCASIFNDNVSPNEKNDVKGNLNAGDCDLELEAKQEMFKPSSTIPSPGDHLQLLDVSKELHKNGTSLQELCSTSNIDLDREEGSPDGSSREKLDFDKSPGDESLDEDVLESGHANSNNQSDDLGGKIEVTSEDMLKEISLGTALEGSSAHTKEVVAAEKPSSPAEKRKVEDREVISKDEPTKRQRVLNVDDVDISDTKASKLTGTATPKEVFHMKRSFDRLGTTGSRDYPKERIVPPAQKPATTSLRIDRFVRPFTLKAVQELLGKTGSICSFWMDHIKTHCYVTYSSVEEAVATRNAIYNLQWPPNNRSYLIAEFIDPQEVKLKLEAPPPPQVPISLSTATTPFQQPNANQALPHPAASLLPTTTPLAKLEQPTSGPGPSREMLPPPPPRNLEPARTLDDLFKKTQTYPRIYYMPLSEEEVSAKLSARNNEKRG